jgi:hypothetical protein
MSFGSAEMNRGKTPARTNVPSSERSTGKLSIASAPASSRWDAEVRVLAWLAVWVSVFSLLFYLRRGDVLL